MVLAFRQNNVAQQRRGAAEHEYDEVQLKKRDVQEAGECDRHRLLAAALRDAGEKTSAARPFLIHSFVEANARVQPIEEQNLMTHIIIRKIIN